MSEQMTDDWCDKCSKPTNRSDLKHIGYRGGRPGVTTISEFRAVLKNTHGFANKIMACPKCVARKAI